MLYMAQVEGTRMFSRVSTSPCYHLPHSLGLMCSVGFSLPLKLLFFKKLFLLVFPRRDSFLNTHLTIAFSS